MSKSTVLTVRLDPDVMQALKMQAQKEKRKTSNLASILIEENVKRLPSSAAQLKGQERITGIFEPPFTNF